MSDEELCLTGDSLEVDPERRRRFIWGVIPVARVQAEKEGRKASEGSTNEWATLRATGVQSHSTDPGIMHSTPRNWLTEGEKT